MPQRSTKVYAGSGPLIGGMNEGRNPALLSDGQYWRGVNITNRGGLIKTRPRWTKVVNLPDSCSRAAVYRLHAGDRLVYTTSQGCRLLNLDHATVTELTTVPVNDKAFFGFPDRYCVIQDGTMAPVVVEEDALYTGTVEHMPIGTIMSYGNYHLNLVPKFVPDNNGDPSTEDGRPSFLVGDILQPFNPSTVLDFTSTNYYNDGGALTLPIEAGFITGMTFMRGAETGSGVGNLVVIAQFGVSAFAVNVPRGSWGEHQIGQVLFSGIGGVSADSIVSINGDVWMRSTDGVRSIGYGTEQSRGTGNIQNLPQSAEVSTTLNMDTEADLALSSMAHADHRLAITTGGRTGNGFKALAVMDGQILSERAKRSPEVWESLWTGFDIKQVLALRHNGKERLAVIADVDGETSLWTLDDDAVGDNGTTPPVCRFYTQSFQFESVLDSVRIETADLWLGDIVGPLKVTVYFRPGDYPKWTEMGSKTITGDGKHAYASRCRFAVNRDKVSCNPLTGQRLDLGKSFQFCIEWEGNCTLVQQMFTADRNAPEVPYRADSVVSIDSLPGVELDDFEYRVIS